MGFHVFSDDLERLMTGHLYLSDCTGLDRELDRELIEFIALHGKGWWMEKFLRRYRIDEARLREESADDPGEYGRLYRLLEEQVRRESDREVLKKAAFTDDPYGKGRFAFSRLTGYRWHEGKEDMPTCACGLKSDMLREDIEAFCREMIGRRGPFADEAAVWLSELETIPDEMLDLWAEKKTERTRYAGLHDELSALLSAADGSGNPPDPEKTARCVFDAYVLTAYEERFGPVTRSRKHALMDAFTRDLYRILKQLNRKRIADETDAVSAVFLAGRAMPDDMTKDRIRQIVWDEGSGGAQHRFFLGLSYRYGIGRTKDEEKAKALLSAAAAEGAFPDRL